MNFISVINIVLPLVPSHSIYDFPPSPEKGTFLDYLCRRKTSPAIMELDPEDVFRDEDDDPESEFYHVRSVSLFVYFLFIFDSCEIELLLEI